MARGRKAVDTGSIRRQPGRNCRGDSFVEAAAPGDVAKPSVAMDSTNSKPKKTPRRAAKDKYEEEKMMTSDKSLLIDINLKALLAHPDAWNCLEESEKKEILDLLPSDIHPNPNPSQNDPNAKIDPLPSQFLLYSNNWGEALRTFQLDLECGRYDPQWVREAEEAVRERAAGKFDKFKEQEFEEFWGQKQKMDRTLAAGASSKIKLSTLIEHGVIRMGDILKWSRSFNRPRVLIEKEARVIEINGPSLTFAIPAGQRTFLKAAVTPDAKTPGTEEQAEDQQKSGPITPPSSQTNGVSLNNTDTESDAKDTEAGPSRKRSAEPDIEAMPIKRPRGRPRKQKPIPIQEETDDLVVETTKSRPEDGTDSLLSHTENNVEPSAEMQNGGSHSDAEPSKNTRLNGLDEIKLGEPEIIDLVDDEPSQSSPEENCEADEVIVRDIQALNTLTSKILEIDGRVSKSTNGNAWKELRCFRNNQDMGTLWEVRQAWFLKNK
ncbi:uncharacterized protein DSM5745_04199 [Aspergillus mulundensis]|uniref:DEUBAD domain-containing protein n=1 Tax=Aspergillus mulundensis TaxID=1810919 RepID=A0A3D8SC63_9EURO|nr:Uncharacterized protein DSM5745_04199 [Aspergillus mulundensis]RDW83873.1 Uncharacterized protein DSM5745_04199 [Aspergillus mulundensis]